MTMNGISGAGNNMQAGRSGMNMQMDSVSKNIQKQIANAQKQLQELSSNEDMTLEEKMKKRQEIQQEITTLNQQLRQHQIEQRKEQQSKGASMNDMLGGTRKAAKAGDKGSGLSQAGMQAMISADASVKQAKVQGSMAAQMEGKAGVLESEIKMDKSRGGNAEKKEEELADLQAKAQTAATAQISSLADASKMMEEASKTDQAAEPSKSKDNKKNQAAKEEERAGKDTESQVNSSIHNETITAEASVAGTVQTVSQQAYYAPIDIRL